MLGLHGVFGRGRLILLLQNPSATPGICLICSILPYSTLAEIRLATNVRFRQHRSSRPKDRGRDFPNNAVLLALECCAVRHSNRILGQCPLRSRVGIGFQCGCVLQDNGNTTDRAPDRRPYPPISASSISPTATSGRISVSSVSFGTCLNATAASLFAASAAGTNLPSAQAPKAWPAPVCPTSSSYCVSFTLPIGFRRSPASFYITPFHIYQHFTVLTLCFLK